jgi:hypothetical protein
VRREKFYFGIFILGIVLLIAINEKFAGGYSGVFSKKAIFYGSSQKE